MDRRLFLFLTAVIVLSLCACGKPYADGAWGESVEAASYSELQWPENELTALLPAIRSAVGEVILQSDAEVSLCVGKISKKEYSDYVKECQKAGFTLVISATSSSCSIDDEAGNRLSLDYDDRQSTMTVSIKRPSA